MRAAFPSNAYQLAVSDWYYDADDHRCPHDSWLEEWVVSEGRAGQREEVRTTSMRIRLRGANHDGHIELRYPRVFAYQFAAHPQDGHRDWRYDEFRLTEEGHVLHEIEWWGPNEVGRWVIEASDVLFEWRPEDVGSR